MTTNIVQTNQFVTLANIASQTVLAIDTGKTLLVPAQGVAGAITLPIPQPGLRYRFMINGNTAGQVIAMTMSGGATTTGLCVNITATPTIAFITKAADPAGVQILAAAPRGTYLDMNCDGSVWYIGGISNAVGFA